MYKHHVINENAKHRTLYHPTKDNADMAHIVPINKSQWLH